MAMSSLWANRRSVVTALVLVVVLLVAGGIWWWREHRSGLHLRGEFTAAVGIYPGNDVRILGVPVGEVDSVTPHGTAVTISMTLNPGVNVRSDTYAVIIAPNLVSDRYVDLTGAYAGGPKLADNTTLGLSRTRTPLELDALYQNLTTLFTALGPNGANKQGALSRLLQVGAANLKGNGSRISQTVRDLGDSASTLAGSKQNIFATITRLSEFTRNLKQHNSELINANDDLASVTGTLADDRQQFALALRHLAQALLLVKSFIAHNRAAVTSNVRRLTGTAKVLAKRRASLAQALRAAPTLLRNFLQAYDPDSNLLRGRADLNELTIWANQQLSSSTSSASSTNDSSATTGGANAGSTNDRTAGTSARTSRPSPGVARSASPASTQSTSPPALLPGVGQSTDVP